MLGVFSSLNNEWSQKQFFHFYLNKYYLHDTDEDTVASEGYLSVQRNYSSTTFEIYVCGLLLTILSFMPNKADTQYLLN